MKLRKLILYICICLLIISAINGVSALSRFNNDAKKSVPKSEQKISQIQSVGEQPSLQHVSKPVNMLVLGVDEEGVRSDVILLINYSPSEGKINMLSVARDTRIRIKNKYEKINALYAIGKEKLITNAIEQLTGLPVDFYFTLNFGGFRKIVDILGGVEFDVPFDMDYDDPDQNLHIHLNKGKQILNGEKAEYLVRYRKGNRSGEGYIDGDMGRIRMQQDFIRALAEQKIKLKYLSKADDIFIILKKYIATNFEMRHLNMYVKDFKNINYDKIKTFTVPGEPAYIENLWYFICDKQKTKQLIKQNFFQ